MAADFVKASRRFQRPVRIRNRTDERVGSSLFHRPMIEHRYDVHVSISRGPLGTE